MRLSRSLLPASGPKRPVLSRRFFGTLFFLAAVSSSQAVPQFVYVPVMGTVRDAESGAPLADAIVSLSDRRQVVATDEHGRYVLDAFPGSQHVTVQRMGYASQEFDALVPPEGTLEINIELRRKPIMLPPIEVRASVPIRDLEHSTSLDFPDRSIWTAALYHHPLLAEPDVLRAIGGGEVVIEPESPSGMHIRGGASDQVTYLIDGVPVFNPYHAAGTFSAWNPDALSSVDLFASSPMPAAPDALSGVVSANTRTPGSRLHTQGSISATQARAMIDGPVGRTGAGYVLSVGSAFPGLVVHKQEPSHVGGENVDWLGKVESPLVGGRLRLVSYGSQNEIDAAATAELSDTAAAIDPTRNTLQWDSRSLGTEWSRPLGRALFVLRSWTASGNADAEWTGPDSLESLASSRRENGLLAMVELPVAGGSTSAGVRLQRSETSYRFRPTVGEPFSLAVTTPVSTIFFEHERSVTAHSEVGFSLASAFVTDDVYFSPSVQLRWQPARTLLFSGTAARRHQFGQSLRNPESIVSNIFPADLYVGAGAAGVPVASSNLGIVAIEHRPNAWLRLGAQAYVRDFDGLALVAPRVADAFATDGFVEGSGTAHGFTLEAGASGTWYGVLASYGFQRVTLEYAGVEYVPGYGAAHSIAAGVVVLPVPTYSIRLGFEGVLGRHTTSTLGSFEWEATNMLDQGGEFAGSPTGWSEALGGSGLPAYYRLDLGVRKQWLMKVGERDGLLAVFGTATNLLARTNVLTFAVDPSTSERSLVEMMPFSPLVVGIDWRF